MESDWRIGPTLHILPLYWVSERNVLYQAQTLHNCHALSIYLCSKSQTVSSLGYIHDKSQSSIPTHRPTDRNYSRQTPSIPSESKKSQPYAFIQVMRFIR